MNGEWKLMAVAKPGDADSAYTEWLIKDETSITSPPDFKELIGYNISAGSIAYTQGMEHMYQLCIDGITWKEM